MALIGMVEDITDRKRAEEALKEAHDELERRIEERTAELKKANEQLAVFHKFTESSPQGFGMADLDGRIAYANPTMCRLFGEADPANVIGNPIGQYYQEGVKERRTNEMLPALERDDLGRRAADAFAAGDACPNFAPCICCAMRKEDPFGGAWW